MKSLLLWVVIIFGSGHYLSTVSEYTNLLILLPLVWMIFALAIACFKQTNLYLQKKNAITLVLLVFPVLIYSVVNLTFGFSEAKYIIILLFVACVCATVEYQTFIKQYVRIMVFISISAIIGYILSFTPLLDILPRIENYNGYEYYSAYLFSGMRYQTNAFYDRIQGMFWEPGILATYTIIALFFIKKVHFKNQTTYISSIILLVVTLLLTKSGAGIILLILLAVIKLFENRIVSNKSTVIICLLIIMLLVFGEVTMQYVDNYLFAKLLNDDSTSIVYRLNSIPIDLLVFWGNPFGVGLSEYSKIVSNYNGMVSSGTSTLTTFLAEFGVMGFFHLFFWISSIHKMSKSKNFIVYWGSMCLFIFILLKEPHGTLILMNCFIFYNSYFIQSNKVDINATALEDPTHTAG